LIDSQTGFSIAGRCLKIACMNKIHILGIGDDGLEGITAQARRLIEEAELVLGAEATLRVLPKATPGKQYVAVGANLEEAVRQLNEAGEKKIVVLASGDPLFYGVARYLCDKLGKDRFEVVPHVSSMQMAFARVKESWEDAYLTNLATYPLENVIEKIRVADTVGLFASDRYPPGVVARALLDQNIDYARGNFPRRIRSAERDDFGPPAGNAGSTDRCPLATAIWQSRRNVSASAAETRITDTSRSALDCLGGTGDWNQQRGVGCRGRQRIGLCGSSAVGH
jgi:precorrin-6Y C5,15-methyltransferase (decarboxylating)